MNKCEIPRCEQDEKLKITIEGSPEAISALIGNMHLAGAEIAAGYVEGATDGPNERRASFEAVQAAARHLAALIDERGE